MIRSTLFALSLLVTATAFARKPNIVVFVADDMGFADCGITGCRDIPTPNIDALASNGVRFTQGYVSGCVCSPSRAGLITGRYQQRFGFDANAEGQNKKDKVPRALDLAQTTLPQRLKPLGYATGMVGKWHLGAQDGYLPNQRGFDFFYGILPFGLAGKGPDGKSPPPVYRNGEVAPTPANHMEAFSTEALGFIDGHRDSPFFLYLPFTAVHAPFVGPSPWIDRHDTAAPASRRSYGADLRQMDDIVGRVMTRLRETDLEENTLVFFFSDNGGPGGAADNGPYRGTKWTLWEGGIHVPFVAQWKGQIPAGRTVGHPIIQVDLAATVLAAAGAQADPAWQLDGVDLMPLMAGQSDVAPHDALYWRFGVQYAVRQGDWKLVKAHIDQAPRLHNLAQDPGEKNDLAAQEPERVKQLQALWDAWNAKNEAPRWIDVRWNGDGAKHKKEGQKKAKAKNVPTPERTP